MSEIIYKINALSKSYGTGDGLIHALKDVNVDIKRGDFVAVTGLSGSGKTTFLNILAGLIEDVSGEVFFENNNLLVWNDTKRARYRNEAIGYIMQNFGLIPTMSVIENVLLPVKKICKEHRKKAHELLERLKIEDKAKVYPHQLSGGQKQRVAIARALIQNPKVILADEPTGALDRENSQMILDILRNIHEQSVTVILVTHEQSLALACPTRLKFQDGYLIDVREY